MAVKVVLDGGTDVDGPVILQPVVISGFCTAVPVQASRTDQQMLEPWFALALLVRNAEFLQ